MIRKNKIKAHVTVGPVEAIQFLEDFKNLMALKDEPTKLVSIRIPENLLRAFRLKAQTEGKKYQSAIVQLMRQSLKT